MSQRFFIETAAFVGEVQLDGPEAHHIGHVMRLQSGEQITLFCGDGFESYARILQVQKKSVLCEVLERVEVNRETGYHLHLAVAFPRGDRGDFLLEKMVELGVSELTPLSTERSVVKAETWKPDKFHRAVIEASKQCGRNILMKVNPPIRWSEFLQLPSAFPKRIAHVGAASLTRWEGNALYAVGPEGGFSEKEVQLAIEHGWESISLGKTILRVETAALAIASRVSGNPFA